MFGLGDNDDEERMWNFLMFKFYATDEEMESGSPIILLLVVVVIIIGIVLYFTHK